MKKEKKTLTEEIVNNHVDTSINKLSTYMKSLSRETATMKKADILAYWLEDYTKYLSSEGTFNPKLYKKYNRGDIIKVNLGFNIGSEEGGLHYAVVVDMHNTISSPTITIVPLSSIKGDATNIHNNDVYLGTQIYDSLSQKLDNMMDIFKKEIESVDDIQNIEPERFNYFIEKIQEIDKVSYEVSRMKSGSYAIVNQITTISKQRIYDPKHAKDILADIRLTNENLDLINEKLKKLYIK